MRLTDSEEATLLDYLLAHPKIREAMREAGWVRPVRYFGRCSGRGSYASCEERGEGRWCEECISEPG